MKKFLLGSFALAALGIGAPAIAADMAVRPVAPAPAFSWTGCHLGGLAGYEWGHSDGYTTSAASTTLAISPAAAVAFSGLSSPAGQPVFTSHDLNGFNGGGYGGCDYQFGSFVVGVEGDWSSVNKSGQGRTTPNILTPGLSVPSLLGGTLSAAFGAPAFVEAQERWYATARGRVGYAVDKWLFFATGGAAWTKVDYSQFMLCGSTAGSGSFTATCSTPAPGYFALDSTRRTGWTVGAGVDYAPASLHGNFVVRADYLYIDFGSFTTFTAPLIGQQLYITNLNTKLNDHVVRFGLAYKFGPNSAALFR